MTKHWRGLAIVLPALLAASGARAESIWVAGYYPGWRQSRMRPESVDYEAVSEVIHFGVVPRADGTLDAAVNMLTPANVTAAVSAAHAAGKKILLTVGGQDTRERFESAMGERRREAFVAALVKFMRDNGYDGIDVDMEDIAARDGEDYAKFIRRLRAELDAVSPRPLLTAAAMWQPALFASLAGEFDQINLMTYNLSGPYPGWVAWHSGSVYDGGGAFSNGQPLPSANGLADAFLAAGVPKEKLGVGLSFNGYVWSGGGVSRPRQAWTTPPSIKNVPYYALAETYGIKEGGPEPKGYRWDADAQAAYISVEGDAPADARFVSYDDEKSAARMTEYVRRKKLGGLIVWDLGAGYRESEPAGRRDALLQAVKKARLAPGEEASR